MLNLCIQKDRCFYDPGLKLINGQDSSVYQTTYANNTERKTVLEFYLNRAFSLRSQMHKGSYLRNNFKNFKEFDTIFYIDNNSLSTKILNIFLNTRSIIHTALQIQNSVLDFAEHRLKYLTTESVITDTFLS